MVKYVWIGLFIGGVWCMSGAASAVTPNAPVVDQGAPAVDYAAAIIAQINLLKSVAAARKNYFISESSRAVVNACLDAAFKNTQRLSRDQAYQEVNWFLEEIARAVGTVGSDVVLGKDISMTITNLFRLAGTEPLVRVWSTALCVEIRKSIYDSLANALSLLPAGPPQAPRRVEDLDSCVEVREMRGLRRSGGKRGIPRGVIIGLSVGAGLTAVFCAGLGAMTWYKSPVQED